MICKIMVHEVRLVIREPRFWIPFLIPPVFLVIMQAVLLSQFGSTAKDLEPTMLLTVGALLATMVVALTADSFAGERERNTLELMLCLPISSRELFLGKLLAILPVPLVLLIVAQVLMWDLMGTPGILVLIKAIVFGVSCCLLISGVSLLVSLHSQTVRSAAQGNVLFVLMILMLTQWISGKYFLYSWIPWSVGLGSLALFLSMFVFGLRRFEKMN